MTQAYFPNLFSVDNAKAAKASGYGYLNAIHYMAPYDSGGVGDLCVYSTPACRESCLGKYSGQASMVSDLENGTNATRESRILKAQLFMNHRADYMNRLARDIARLVQKASREGLKLCVRLNGSTDLPFERIRFEWDSKTSKILGLKNHLGRPMTLLECFPDIQFIDYTKNPGRFGKAPKNLDLTFSYSVQNYADCARALNRGQNVAMVFADTFPQSFAGFPVINGDLHDLRHLDPKSGVIVGLTPKGRKAKRDESGFVVRDVSQLESAFLGVLFGPVSVAA